MDKCSERLGRSERLYARGVCMGACKIKAAVNGVSSQSQTVVAVMAQGGMPRSLAGSVTSARSCRCREIDGLLGSSIAIQSVSNGTVIKLLACLSEKWCKRNARQLDC